MGVELLEERYQCFIVENPDCIEQLKNFADQNNLIQLNMRAVLDTITAELCPECKAPCCQCMPVEGWFTEADYYLYRTQHDAPFKLRVNHGIPNGCAFLGETGCVLPAGCRPFPCVKVNCKSVTTRLEQNDTLKKFTQLYDAMDALQKKLWHIINPEKFQKAPDGGKPA